MISIPIRTRGAADGIITLHIPPAYCNKEVEAYLIVQPIAVSSSSNMDVSAWREELQSLAGSISDSTFDCGESGNDNI